MTEPHLRDQDLVRWIENKLGSSELWGGRHAASVLNREILLELETCFQELEPATKIKIITSMVHISPKTLQSWKEPLLNLLELARRDPDDWVEAMADLFWKFPALGCIHFSFRPDSYFNKTLDELMQNLSKKVEENDANLPLSLPPDSELMNVTTIQKYNCSGYLFVEPKYSHKEIQDTYMHCDLAYKIQKHFSTRKQETKSTKLLTDLKKAFEQQNNPTNRKNHGLISSFPIKIRSTAKKYDNQLPMKGLSSSSNALKISSGFSNDSKKFQQRTLSKREGGAQLLDIAELPQKNRRRRTQQSTPMVSDQPAITQLGQQQNTTAINKKLLEKLDVPPSPLKMAKQMRQWNSKHDSNYDNNLLNIKRDRLMSGRNEQSTDEISVNEQNRMENMGANENARSNGIPNNLNGPTMECSTDPSTSATPCIKQDPIDNLINNNNQRLFPSSHNPFMMNNVDLQQSSELNSSCFNNLFAEIGSQYSQHIPTMNNSMPESEVVKQFTGLLKDANKLSPVSYNMIIAFLSGNKNNPLKDKLGELITLPLSESIEFEQNEIVGVNAFLVETFFQMNYCTGEWKRLRKSKLLSSNELDQYRHHQGSKMGTDQHMQQQIELTPPIASSSSDILLPNFGGQLLQQQQQNYWTHRSLQQTNDNTSSH